MRIGLSLSVAVAAVSLGGDPTLVHHQASRMSMGCLYTIEVYGADSAALSALAELGLDEVDRIDRLMSHYQADSPLSRINREAARQPVAVQAELFDFVADALRYTRESDGAFDITVGPLMNAWGFFRGEGRLPSSAELHAARRHVGSGHVRLDPTDRTIAFDEAGVALDLGGIAKGYAVDRVVHLLRERDVEAALVSAGGSTIYGLGAPPKRDAWTVDLQDPIDARKIALSVKLRDRALSVAGRSEKSFQVDGVTYSHIMDPRTGSPVQGMLTVAVLTTNGTAGDALDDAFFVLGPKHSARLLRQHPKTEVFFLVPAADRGWRIVHRGR